MADILSDGKTRVSWVPTIANNAAPTAAELNAGTTLTSVITPDGVVGFEPETAAVDNSSLASTFDTKTIGRASFGGTMLRLKKQDGTDTARNLFTTRGTTGYIVIRRWVDFDTAWASGQRVSVYPVTVGDIRDLAPEANTVSKYEVPLPVSSAATLHGAVA